MAAIGSLKSSGSADSCPTPARRLDQEVVGPAGAPAQSRALVRVSPVISTSRTTAGSHPAAGFLAHLIATAQGAPQTRVRRRAEPDYAGTVYAAAATDFAQTGRYVRRVA